jgi:6-pyruvoyltetrahydropterin/6-carboxytetrahydropterin synthase
MTAAPTRNAAACFTGLSSTSDRVGFQDGKLTKPFEPRRRTLSGTTLRSQRGKPRPFFRTEVTGAARPIRRPEWAPIPACSSAHGEVQKMLDHKLLNRIEALGPPTLDNLSRFIWERVQHAGKITRVSVHRDSCNESCAYYGPER